MPLRTLQEYEKIDAEERQKSRQFVTGMILIFVMGVVLWLCICIGIFHIATVALELLAPLFIDLFTGDQLFHLRIGFVCFCWAYLLQLIIKSYSEYVKKKL